MPPVPRRAPRVDISRARGPISDPYYQKVIRERQRKEAQMEHTAIGPVEQIARGLGGAVINYATGGDPGGTLEEMEQRGRVPIEVVPSYGTGGRSGCPPGFTVARDSCTGEIYCKKTRKRRKRLLTCSDKADLAFIIGQLGKGAAGTSAISSLLARCG